VSRFGEEGGSQCELCEPETVIASIGLGDRKMPVVGDMEEVGERLV